MRKLKEPLNERDTIFFFDAIQECTQWRLVYCGKPFPDAIISNGYETLLAEFEYKAANFVKHGHDPQECDLIIYWFNDWKDALIPVLSLSDMALALGIDVLRSKSKNAEQKYSTIGLSRQTKLRFDSLRSGYRSDPFLNRLMDLWQIMSPTERAEYFDRASEAEALNQRECSEAIRLAEQREENK